MRPTDAPSPAEPAWERIQPLLNDALLHLPASDRDLIVLRYLEGRSTAEIARDRAIPEGTIRQRLSRALQRLRAHLARRGITTTDQALSAALLLAHTPGSAAALLATITALVSGASPSPSSLTLANGAMHAMKIAKAQVIAAVAITIALLSVTAYALISVASAKPPATPVATAAPATLPTVTRVASTTPSPETSVPGPISASTQTIRLSPKALVLAAYQKGLAGDEQAFLTYWDKLDDAQTNLLRQMVQTLAAFNDLTQAVSDKYGQDVRAQLANRMGMGVTPADLENAIEAIGDDTATVAVSINNGTQVVVVQLVKIGADWKLSTTTLTAINPGGVAQSAALAPKIKQAAADIRAGKYPTPNDAQQALLKALQP